MNLTKTYVLYHGQCFDGFTAAWAAREKFKHITMDVEYIPVFYNQPPPVMEEKSHVYILDFAYPREVLTDLAFRHRIIVLDHHKTSAAALEGLPPIKPFDIPVEFHLDLQVHFDMNKSGAMLAWEFFHGDHHIPKLVRLVQDRDLWKFEMHKSDLFHAYLRSFNFDFHTWTRINDGIEHEDRFDAFCNEGKAIQRQIERDIESMAFNAREGLFFGKKAVLANATTHFSEVCHHLLGKFPDAEMAVVYGMSKSGRMIYSLRSRTIGEVDVSAIALSMGGGGHKHAAGFKSNDLSLLSNFYGGQQ